MIETSKSERTYSTIGFGCDLLGSTNRTIQVVTNETKVFALKRTSGSRSCVDAAVWAAVIFDISSCRLEGQIELKPFRRRSRELTFSCLI